MTCDIRTLTAKNVRIYGTAGVTSRGAAVEVNAIGEQQSKQTQSGSSS